MLNNDSEKNKRQEYQNEIKNIGKRDFTFKKMLEFGFWPKNLPTPYERQKDETKEEYQKRKELLKELEKLAGEISKVCTDKKEIQDKLKKIQLEYNETWDYEKIRRDVSKKIMQESIQRRADKKKQQELKKIEKTNNWNNFKSDNIVFIGRGYSNLLNDKINDEAKLNSLNLPIINDDKSLANILGIEYKVLRMLTFHRDVDESDNYFRYTIPKKNGGNRNIAAPKKVLKDVQRKILNLILEKVLVSDSAHGFLKEKSIVTGASSHFKSPELLLNMDLENFFPTITFERVRGLFKSFGYSGFISSLLAMLCTYCERTEVEIKGKVKYVKSSGRILPQGSPASPMITNIICRNLDKKINSISDKFNFTYSRYADDMSFSFKSEITKEDLKKFIFTLKSIVNDEGFRINENKTRYLKKNNRQCVTGIVINNSELGVPKIWLKRFRASIFNASKNKSLVTKEKLNEISGMASWLNSVNKEKYSKIIFEAKNLLDELSNS